MNNLVNVNFSDLFTFYDNPSMRNNVLKILPNLAHNDYRRFYFSCNVVYHWNSMFESERCVPSVSHFKKCISNYFDRNDIW